jgi:hypothetical protein
MAWSFGVAILVRLYSIETWFVLLGLVVSDIFQAACRRRTKPRETEEEQTSTSFEMKREMGLGSPV